MCGPWKEGETYAMCGSLISLSGVRVILELLGLRNAIFNLAFFACGSCMSDRMQINGWDAFNDDHQSALSVKQPTPI
jgi:hypothetical protein